MGSVLVRRGVQAALLIVLVTVINFFLFRVMPGDPIYLMISGDVTAEMKEMIRHQYGLDKPIWMQFVIYLKDVAKGNLGTSFSYHRPVLGIILERLPNTILLLLSSNVLSILMSVVFGLIAAWKRGSTIDISSMVVSLALYSMPIFWLGGLLLLYFGVHLDMFPISGIVSPWIRHTNTFSYIADVARHLFLPMMALAIGGFGGLFLIMRNSLLDVFSEDYVVTARAIGIPNRTVLFKNVLRNAMLPLVTIVMLRLGFMVGGAVTTETVFSWPGVGLLLYNAAMSEDYPMLQGTFLIITIFVVLANFLADILYGYLDPRVRYE